MLTVTGTNLDVVQEPRVRVKYAGHESVNVSETNPQILQPGFFFDDCQNAVFLSKNWMSMEQLTSK